MRQVVGVIKIGVLAPILATCCWRPLLFKVIADDTNTPTRLASEPASQPFY